MLCCSSSAQSQCGSTVYTHSQGKVEGNLWVHTQQQQQQQQHTLSQRKERRIQSLEGQILLLMMMMMMMMSLIITQSAAISQSFFCFVLPSFFNMGTPSISKFSYCGHSVSSSSSSSLPCLLPFFPLQARQLLCPALGSGKVRLFPSLLAFSKPFPEKAWEKAWGKGKALGKGLGEGKALGKGLGEGKALGKGLGEGKALGKGSGEEGKA